VTMGAPEGYRVLRVGWDDRGDDLAAIRERVFVVEQGVPRELELDGLDAGADHVLAWGPDGHPAGCGRMLADGHIGRMAVLPAHRRRGVGGALLAALLERARERGLSRVFLHAQVTAAPFYESHGFASEGDVFLDAGIPHRYMFRYVETRGPVQGTDR